MNPFKSPTLVMAAVLLIPLLAGCDSMTYDALDSDVVVEMVLIADEPLPPLWLSRTVALEQTIDLEAQAIGDAEVTVSLRGSEQAPVRFLEKPGQRGHYYPTADDHLVEPGGTYDLNVLIPGESISSSTTVPGRFELLSASLDSAVYQSDEQLLLTITQSTHPGRELNYFTIVTESLDLRAEQLVPLAVDVLETDEEATLEDFRFNGSPLVSSGNFDVHPDGTITIRYPWIGVIAYGPNRLSINAVDDNLYDLIRSQSVQQGGSTFGPGEIPNPIENIQGAHGIFGSMARVTYDFVVLRPDGASS
ncbi:MAG: DUF4249 family protein [Bacteroidota bacterium]|nr:DUF4249 family protein [Bacteroidota bacterium]MDE2833944.1 DUF4249 family protein [Bacteroidota bacterium]